MRRFIQISLCGLLLCLTIAVSGAARNVIVIMVNGAGPSQFELARRAGARRAGLSNTAALPVTGTLLPLSGQFEHPDIASLNALAAGTAFDRGFGVDPEGGTLESLLAEARHRGMKTGFVTDGALNAPGGAAFWAHEVGMPSAEKLTAWLPLADLDVISGGLAGEGTGKGAFSEIAMRQLGYVVSREQLSRPLPDKRLFALHSAEEMDFYSADLPEGAITLPERVSEALRWLFGPQGLLLIVECSRLQRAASANDTAAVITELWEFDRVLGRTLDFFKRDPEETLIVVVSLFDVGDLRIREDLEPLPPGPTRRALAGRLAEERLPLEAALELAGAGELFAAGSPQMREVAAFYDASSNAPEQVRDYSPWIDLVFTQRDRHRGVVWAGRRPSISLSSVLAIGCGMDDYDGEYDAVELHEKLRNSLGISQRPE